MPRPGSPKTVTSWATSVADRPGHGFSSSLELRLATDERRREAARRVRGTQRAPCPERLRAPLDLERACVVDLDRARREPAGRTADEDLPGLCPLLQARRQVDRLARREGRVAALDDDLPRLDSDPHGETQLLDHPNDLQSRANGTLGVVLVCERHAERRHHRVARELLDRAAVRLDPPRHSLEIAVHTLANDLRVRARHEARRVDEIREQDRCDLALHHPLHRTGRSRDYPVHA